MSKFLLTTTAPTSSIVSEADLPFLMLSADSLISVPEPTTERPSDNHILVADQDDNNVWFTSWMLSSEYNSILENKAHISLMKQLRNKLLAACDWTQNVDVPNSISHPWAEYREALRNVTKQEGFPTNIIWPAAPTEFKEVEDVTTAAIPGPAGQDGKDGKDGADGLPGAVGPQGVAGPAGVGIKGIATGYVDAGTFVTLDNIKATVTTTGNRGLSVATVSGTMTLAISATYSVTGGGNGQSTAWPGASVTTSPSGSWFGYHFPNAGDGSTYLVNDYNNQRFYRIHLMIGPGYSKNFISIERLA